VSIEKIHFIVKQFYSDAEQAAIAPAGTFETLPPRTAARLFDKVK
jgi:hypothetical protein